jgi:hypothetical protein
VKAFASAHRSDIRIYFYVSSVNTLVVWVNDFVKMHVINSIKKEISLSITGMFMEHEWQKPFSLSRNFSILCNQKLKCPTLCSQQCVYHHTNVTILLTFWPLNAFRSWWPWVPPLSFVSSWSRRPSFTRWTRKALQSNECWHKESQCIAEPSWLTEATPQCKEILFVSVAIFVCNNLKILNRTL